MDCAMNVHGLNALVKASRACGVIYCALPETPGRGGLNYLLRNKRSTMLVLEYLKKYYRR